MNKNILVFLITSLILFSCSDKKKNKNYLENEHINGKVKLIEELYYEVAEEGEEPYSISSKLFFDEEGNRIKEEYFDADKKSLGKKEYDHDDRCNQIAVREYEPDGKRNNDAFDRVFNENNQIIEMVIKSDVVDLHNTYSYKYDSKENPIEETTYDELDKKIFSKKINTFDDHGNIIITKGYKGDGKFSFTKYKKYDERGNLLEEKNIREDGTIETIDRYKYDEHNNILEEIYCNAKEEPFSRSTFTYLNFDDKNNWMKKICAITGEKTRVWERKIEYY